MDKAAKFLKKPYTRAITPEEGVGFSAEILEFPGCYATGETPEEAFHNLEEVAKEWIECELECGNEIPEPNSVESYSGKFALRLSRSLHRQATRQAEQEGVSLNQYFVTAIAARVGAEDLFSRIAEKAFRMCQPTDWDLRETTGSVIGSVKTSTMVYTGFITGSGLHRASKQLHKPHQRSKQELVNR